MTQREISQEDRETVVEGCRLIAPKIVRVGAYLSQAISRRANGAPYEPFEKLFADSMAELIIDIAESGILD